MLVKELSRAHNVVREDLKVSVNDLKVTYLDIDQIITRYDEDQFFCAVVDQWKQNGQKMRLIG